MNERIEAFLAYLEGERSLSPNTISAYRNDLLQFADYLRAEAQRQGGTDFAVSTVDRELITNYFLHLRDRGYSAASIVGRRDDIDGDHIDDGAARQCLDLGLLRRRFGAAVDGVGIWKVKRADIATTRGRWSC